MLKVSIQSEGRARRRLLINSAAGAIQALLSGAVLFVLYRILLKHIGSEQIGIWSLLMAWLSLGRLADLGLPGGMVRFAATAFADGENSHAIAILRKGIFIACSLTAIAIIIEIMIIWAYKPAYLFHRSDVTKLLVFGGLATWLSCVSVAIRAGLDALQRVDLRHITTIVQNILLLLGVCIFVSSSGLMGLMLAQLIATGATVIFTIWALIHELSRRMPAENSLPIGNSIHAEATSNLLAYGLPFQATTVSGLLLDPLVRLLLGSFAGLAAIGWYEMASRLTTQVRLVIVNSMETLVPHIAALGDKQRKKHIDNDYCRVFAINLTLVSVGMSLLIINLPLIGLFWIGSNQPLFLLYSTLLAYAWWFNALAAPAYYIAQGLGVQRWNVTGQVTMAVVNVLIGFALGILYGGMGIVVAFALALVIGSMVILWGLQRELNKITGRKVRVSVPKGYILLAMVAAWPVIIAWHAASPLRLLLVSLPISIIVLAVIWYTGELHEITKLIITRFKYSNLG